MSIRTKYTWTASNVDDLLSDGYNTWVLEVESPPATWTAISSLTVMPEIVSGMSNYVFNGSASSTTTLPTIRARAYRASDDSYYATPYDVTVSLAGYCTIADIRDEGYAITAYPDETVQQAINASTSIIDRLTRQWFEPRYKRVSLDGKGIDTLFLYVPIVTITKVEVDGSSESLDNYEFYNRHLTHGIVSQDDRADPRICWGENRTGVDIRRLYGGGDFQRARKSIVVSGLFGYTDLGPDDFAGETVKGNQIPVSYGVTPGLINQAAKRLTIRHMQTFSDGDDSAKASRLLSEKTRDQSYTLAAPSTADSSYGLTGDLEVDKILMMYQAPIDLVGV